MNAVAVAEMADHTTRGDVENLARQVADARMFALYLCVGVGSSSDLDAGEIAALNHAADLLEMASNRLAELAERWK